MEELIVVCPHCSVLVLIEQLNCCIFRHGTIIESGKQIDPHAPKEICDFYALRNKIYGCGKPFTPFLIQYAHSRREGINE
jgi:hypothetical protein